MIKPNIGHVTPDALWGGVDRGVWRRCRWEHWIARLPFNFLILEQECELEISLLVQGRNACPPIPVSRGLHIPINVGIFVIKLAKGEGG